MVLSKKQQLINMQRIAERGKLRDTFLLSQIYTCPYCSKETNLRCIIVQHFKSKDCQKMKELFLRDTGKTEFDVLSNIKLTISKSLNSFKYDPNFNETVEGGLYKYKLESDKLKEDAKNNLKQFQIK
jgi:hypothetical protein